MLGSSVKSHWWSRGDLLLILLLGLLLYIPGIGPWRDILGDNLAGVHVPLFDRDEPRFATAARNMLQTGDYLIPRFNGELRPDKPPLVYWVMTVSYRLVGQNELGARLPSALFGSLTLLVVYFIAGSRFGRGTGLMASLMLGACSLFVAESRLATADSTMVFFTTVCLGLLWNAWEAGNPPGSAPARLEHIADHQLHAAPVKRIPLWQALAFWVALALGTLTKGVPLAFVFVPMVTLSITTGTFGGLFAKWWKQPLPQALAQLPRMLIHLPSLLWRAVAGGNWAWWRQLRPLAGFPILILLVASWFVAAGIQTHGELINGMIGVHLILRVFGQTLGPYILNFLHIPIPILHTDAMSTYRQPPGYYLALVWLTFWPWTPLLIPAAFYLIRRARGKTVLAIDRRPYQFILAWIIPMWIILEISSGKLMHYVLPLYPAMIILSADMLVASAARLTDVMAARWLDYARWAWMCVWFALAATAYFGLKFFVHDPAIAPYALLFAGILLAAGVATTMEWGRPNWVAFTAFTWVAALLALNVGVMPNINELRISQQVMERIGRLESHGFAFSAMGYEEPTLVFYGPHTIPMRSISTDDQWARHLGAFFAPVPKRDALPTDALDDPAVKRAMIVDDATLAEFKAQGRVEGLDYYKLSPTWTWLRRAPWDPKPEYHVTIITNAPTLALLAATQAAENATNPATSPATNPATNPTTNPGTNP